MVISANLGYLGSDFLKKEMTSPLIVLLVVFSLFLIRNLYTIYFYLYLSVCINNYIL